MSIAPGRRIVFLAENRIKTPPMTASARVRAGGLLRALQNGESLGMPQSRPMPSVGPGCHELRVRDEAHHWRIFYRVDADFVVVIGTFPKATPKTPKRVIDLCRRRIEGHDAR